MWVSGGPGRLSRHEGTTHIHFMGKWLGPWDGLDALEKRIPLVHPPAPPRESNPGSSVVRFSQIRFEFTNRAAEYTGPLPCSFLIIGFRYPALFPKFGIIVLPCYIVHYVSVLSASI